MNYSFNKHFPQRFDHLQISHQIVRRAFKKLPNKTRADKDFRDRMSRADTFTWTLHVDDGNNEVWLSCAYMWARHCFKLDPGATTERLLTLFDLVEEW